MKLENLVFVAFNARAAALDRRTGEMLWQWKAPQGTGFVSLLLDGDRLIAAVKGYTYCLDPTSGEQLWFNPMKGFGYGVTSIASVRGQTPHPPVMEQQRTEAAAASGAAAS